MTEFIHMSMGKQDLYFKIIIVSCELSGSEFHSVTSSHVILYNDVKNSIFMKVDLSGFGNELFNSTMDIVSFEYRLKQFTCYFLYC